MIPPPRKSFNLPVPQGARPPILGNHHLPDIPDLSQRWRSTTGHLKGIWTTPVAREIQGQQENFAKVVSGHALKLEYLTLKN